MGGAALRKENRIHSFYRRAASVLTRAALPLADAALLTVGVVLGYAMRFDGHIPPEYWAALPRVVLFWVVVRLVWLLVYGFYGLAWQYASIRETFVVLSAVTAGTITLYAGNLFLAYPRVPRSIFAIEWFLAAAALGGSRFLIRLWHDSRKPVPQAESEAGPGSPNKRLLIIGAGDAGAIALREIRNATCWGIVGLIDDDPRKLGHRIAGVSVLGDRHAIPEVVARERVNEILIAMPSVSRHVIKEVVAIAQQTGCPVRILPALHELIGGRVTVNQIRVVQIEDLLGREPIRTDVQAISAYLTDRIVLVTGAGGSIGSELCRQVADFRPKRLILVGHGENSIFDVALDLRSSCPTLDLLPVIADIKDAARIERLFAQHRPDVIFHAAAHKHVPLMEQHPDEAVRNNVFGTLNVACAARHHGAQKFVLISTDKAVNPTSVMGMTKRLAEMCIQSLNGRDGTVFMAVRFGNVLGSRGSVVPIFKKQIARGGPVTVTHPDMTRYFMTIPEAVQLVIQAGALGRGHEVFVLDMGEPVRIVDLAHNLIRLSGFEPELDIKVEFTGVRPGEKLREELFTADEGMNATCHSRIFIAQPDGFEQEKLEAGLGRLEGLVVSGDLDAIRSELAGLMPGVSRVAEEAAAARE